MKDGIVILGIDPGSRTTGYSILTQENGKWIADVCSVISLANIEDHPARLQHIFEEITRIINKYNPVSCAIETPVYGVDPLAMLKLGRAQAAAMLAVTNKKLPVQEYLPKVVKKSITGNGNANKEQVAYMLSKIVSLPENILKKDATDALAVAWCHAQSLSGIPTPKGKTHQNNKLSDWAAYIRQNPDKVKKP